MSAPTFAKTASERKKRKGLLETPKQSSKKGESQTLDMNDLPKSTAVFNAVQEMEDEANYETE